MAHDHHHHGESVSSYFTEQLLSLLVCGLIGYAAVAMYMSDRLGFLTDQFKGPVLWGGIAILVVVVLRMIAVWKEAGELQAQARAGAEDGTPVCGVDHVHTADCAHDPNVGGHADDHDHDHDHSHSHDMSWTFARMLILVFPVGLFFLGLPNATLGRDWQLKQAGGGTALGAAELGELAKDATPEGEPKKRDDGSVVQILRAKNGLKIEAVTPPGGGEPRLSVKVEAGAEMRFNDLNDAAFDAAKRQELEGKTAILAGRFKRVGDKEFTLFRMKMACCATDTVMLKVRIIVPQAMTGTQIKDFDWVRVKGQIQFYKVSGGPNGAEQYIPVLMVADIKDVVKEPVPANEYDQ